MKASHREQLFEQMSQGVWQFDAAGATVFANPRMSAMVGRTPEELVAAPPLSLVREEDRGQFAAQIARRRRGVRDDFECRLVRKDGATTPVLVEAIALYRDDGEYDGTLAVVSDTSAQKQAEDALREGEARLREVLENSLAASYKRNLITNDYDYFSPAFARICGYTPDEMQNLPLETVLTLVDPGDAEEIGRVVADAMVGAAGAEYQVQYRFQHKDGSPRWLQDRFSVMRDADGRNVALIGSVSDITARRQAEAENARLEADKLESIGRLAGGVAHEFNNMLAVILGHAELALDQVEPGQWITEDLEEMRSAAMRCADLTRQLLAFAMKQVIAPRALNVNDCLAGSLAMLQRLVGRDVRLTCSPGSHLWSVLVDPSQIHQMLAHLCVNARDALGGSGTLTIETANVTIDKDYCDAHGGCCPPGEYVRLSVSDDGRGMGAEVLTHVFEPFFMTNGVGKGTGLSLASVYGIVGQNGGYIDVSSKPGVGTTFRIYLPRHLDEAAQGGMSDRSSQPQRGHETILLVESLEAIRRATARLLEGYGYAVVAAASAREAIALAQQSAGPVHLLLTDVFMPEMDGRDLARHLRATLPGLKVLLMSGSAESVIGADAYADESAGLLQKPFSKRELGIKVREALDGAADAPPSSGRRAVRSETKE